MFKNVDYYLSLDLGSVPEHVKGSLEVRAMHELWKDMLTAIWLRSESSPVPTDQLRAAVGAPDDIRLLDDTDEAWSYNWLGKHGPNTYSSATPFRVRDGAVIGIVDRDGDL